MYQALLEAVARRPAPYEATDSPFWDDAYLSGQFLRAHLAPSAEAATRMHAFVHRSALWIATLARGSLLDLGCGPGIYAEQFHDRGFAVTGVDISARSIEYAQASAQARGMAITYRRENYLDMQDEACYDIATMIYCDYGVLGPQARATLLRNVRRALKPGGLLVLDAWSPAHYEDYADALTVEDAPGGGFWSAGPYAALKRTQHYAPATYLDRYIVVKPDALREYNVWNTAFDRQSLAGELQAAGFGDFNLYGDVAGAPYAVTGDTLCMVARR